MNAGGELVEGGEEIFLPAPGLRETLGAFALGGGGVLGPKGIQQGEIAVGSGQHRGLREVMGEK